MAQGVQDAIAYLDPEDSLECSSDVYRNSCVLAAQQYGERDALAAVRMIASSLSVLGSVSIILGVIVDRQVVNPRIHPIFQLSFADLLFSFLWIVGGSLWLREDHDRVGCLVVALLTVIFECVTVNLKLVYALSIHTLIMKRDMNRVLYHKQEQVWHPLKTTAIYVTAWVFPVIPLIVTFGALAAHTSIVSGASDCSCWCLPELGNVLPYAIPRDQATAEYLWHVTQLVVSFSSLLFLNYFVVCVCLCIIYVRIRRRIALANRKVEASTNSSKISSASPRAKKRVMYFLTTFVVLGFINLLLSMVAMVYEGLRLRVGPVISPSYHLHTGVETEPAHGFHVAIHLIQSFTVPLHGFITAIVYGWTKDDALPSLSVMTSNVIRSQDAELEVTAGQDEYTDSFYDRDYSDNSEEELEPASSDHSEPSEVGYNGDTTYQSIVTTR